VKYSSRLAHHLTHCSAAGRDATNIWEYDSGVILASIRCASAPVVHVAIPVKPILKRDRAKREYAIVCISSNADRWAIEHGVYDGHLPYPHPLLPAMALVLTHAPEEVAKLLAAI
jgi:hypothetical protein